MLLKGNQAVYPTLDFPFDFLLTLPARSVKKASGVVVGDVTCPFPKHISIPFRSDNRTI